MKEMPVIAVDPAPGKESTVFDGTKFLKLSPRELRLGMPSGLVNETLLCWDAPLTGPGDPESAGADPSDFTQRPVEKFFSRKETGFKASKGISVRPYSGCPHWAISRSILGLPRTGPYDHGFDRLPFHLLPRAEEERAGRPSVVEIHPAVGAWLWCREWRTTDQWRYKDDIGTLRSMWSIISSRTSFQWADRPGPSNDDEFDAAVGFLLGAIYLRDRMAPVDEQEVVLLGDRRTGAFLLPAAPNLLDTWRAWLEDNSVLANDWIRPGRGTS